MAVYVDDARAELGRLVMCRMIADTSRELRAFLRRLGVSAKWIQHPGTAKEYFGLSLQKRAVAVTIGALPITQAELDARLQARRPRQTSTLLRTGT